MSALGKAQRNPRVAAGVATAELEEGRAVRLWKPLVEASVRSVPDGAAMVGGEHLHTVGQELGDHNPSILSHAVSGGG